MTIGDRIKHYRQLRKMTQSELARKLDVQDATISKYELGTVTNIPWERLEQLAAALEVPTGWLIGFDKIPEEPTPEQRELTELLPGLTADQIRLLLSMAKQMVK